MNHPTLKSLTLGIGLFFTLPLVYANSSFPSSSDGTLYINKSKTRKVAPVKYGFHYEEIGMMGEGALHAELIRNRSFEEATPPAGLSVKNGLYENVPAPRVKEKKVFQADPLIGWTTYPLSYAPVFVSSSEGEYALLTGIPAPGFKATKSGETYDVKAYEDFVRQSASKFQIANTYILPCVT